VARDLVVESRFDAPKGAAVEWWYDPIRASVRLGARRLRGRLLVLVVEQRWDGRFLFGRRK